MGAVEILPEEERRVDFAGLCDEDIEICPVGKPAGFFFLPSGISFRRPKQKAWEPLNCLTYRAFRVINRLRLLSLLNGKRKRKEWDAG